LGETEWQNSARASEIWGGGVKVVEFSNNDPIDTQDSIKIKMSSE